MKQKYKKLLAMICQEFLVFLELFVIALKIWLGIFEGDDVLQIYECI